MRFPVRSDGAAKQRFGGLYVLAIEQEAQSGAPLVEQLGQLGYAYVGKVLWSEPQELPLPVVHRLKRKLMLQVKILPAELLEEGVGGGFGPMALSDGLGIEQSRLPQEEGFYLQEVVGMVGNAVERYAEGPILKGLTVDSETVVAGQCYEVSGFPRAVATAYPFLDGLRSEEHTSELQSRQYLVCRLLLEKKKKSYSMTIRR